MTNTPHDNDQGEADALADVIDSVPQPDDDFVTSHPTPVKKKMPLPQKALLGVGGLAVLLMAGYAYTTMKAPAVVKTHPKPMFTQTQNTTSGHPAGDMSATTFETPKLPAGMTPPADPLGFDAKRPDAAAGAPPKSPVVLDKAAASDPAKPIAGKAAIPAFDSIKPIPTAKAADPFAAPTKASDPFSAPSKTADPFAAKPQPVIAVVPASTPPAAAVKPVSATVAATPTHHKVVKKSRKIKAKAKRVIVSTPPEENGYARLF